MLTREHNVSPVIHHTKCFSPCGDIHLELSCYFVFFEPRRKKKKVIFNAPLANGNQWSASARVISGNGKLKPLSGVLSMGFLRH